MAKQAGKTTLAREFTGLRRLSFDAGLIYFDLEDPAHLEGLRNSKLALDDYCSYE